jgi:hypothetical protein
MNATGSSSESGPVTGGAGSATAPSRSSVSPDLRPAHPRTIPYVLPPPVSAAHGVSVLLVGFAVEGATEVYQFLARGNLEQGAIVYYTTLATTIFGFYLMFLGLREWRAFHPAISWEGATPRTRDVPWVGIALWVGGTGATAVLSVVSGTVATGTTPVWIAWPVGGLIVLAIGSFFYGLRQEAGQVPTRLGVALGWAAFVWSLGVGTVAGLVVGDRSVQLLTEFVTNWVALIASVGPIVVAMAPLAVAYALMISAFWPALRVSTAVGP